MRRRLARLLATLVLLLTATGACSGGGGEPASVPFTRVDLPGGAMPVVLAPAGDTLLIGVRRDGQPLVPGLLRRAPDGSLDEVPVQAASPYGVLATWRSITTAGGQVVAVGGERGGAHGHVRWSVWRGAAGPSSSTGPPGAARPPGSGGSGGDGSGLQEQVQGFSVFGGYEAGDLVGAVLTPPGPVIVGGWASARLGFDIAAWTTGGDTWTRQSSAGTALESGPDTLNFPMSAAELGPGVVVAGWRLALDAGGRQLPAVWRSAAGATGWSVAELPDAGAAGSALAVACWDSGCGVAGRVDGALAVWRLVNGAWTRLDGLPRVAVGDLDRPAAPVEAGGQLVQALSDGGLVRIARTGGDGWTVRPAAGPAGTVTAAARAGDSLYLLAGPDPDHQTLWRAPLATLSP